MRNLLQYPITQNEVIQILNSILLEKTLGNVVNQPIGSLEPLILEALIKAISNPEIFDLVKIYLEIK